MYRSDSVDAAKVRGVDSGRLQSFVASERVVFSRVRPRSAQCQAQGPNGYYADAPMHWMLDWPTPFPLVIANASNATLTDIDGISLADFCLGDTGSMFGHSPAPVVRAIERQVRRGLTYMLPTPEALAVGPLLRERFGLPYWQVATTASDANRFALRVARAVTGRAKILVMQGCYHGAVDETYVALDQGKPVNRAGLVGQTVDLTADTKIVEFNDVQGLTRALADRDVACVITEPVLTNCSMVLPAPGYHQALRQLTREAGTLLLIDETHTISTGPGGYTRAFQLQPDLFVLGKPIAGGIAASVWGFTDHVAARWDEIRQSKADGHSGIGTTLSANALAMAAMQAVLTEVMTDEAYAHMERLAVRLEAGLSGVIDRYHAPWHVARVGARIEFICAPGPLKNGSEALHAHAPALEQAIHLGLVNRGCLIAPFHNMMLICPATTAVQVDTLIAAFSDVVGQLIA